MDPGSGSPSTFNGFQAFDLSYDFDMKKEYFQGCIFNNYNSNLVSVVNCNYCVRVKMISQ